MRAFVISLITTLLWTTSASAISVTNRDDQEYKLTVIEGDAEQSHVLKPAEVLEGVCQKGCVIRLSDSESDEYELEGSEIVSIEEGYLYFDGPEVPDAPATGDIGTPSPPSNR